MPIRPLESGVLTADSQAVGFGVTFGRKVAGGQEAECRVQHVQLISSGAVSEDPRTAGAAHPGATNRGHHDGCRSDISRASLL